MMLEGLPKQPPSLVDLCVRTAIDNRRYLGNVGAVDFQLLERILVHCTLEQLRHIEDCTQDKETDLSEVTNRLWKRFYEKQFGAEQLNFVMEEMKKRKVNVKWRELYETKVILLQEEEQKAVDRLRERYKNEVARKQNRQTKLCSKAPPIKKGFWGNSGSGYNVSNVKSNIMKKARLDVLKSQEVKNLTAIKRNTIQKSFSISAPKRIGLSTSAPSSSRSNSYQRFTAMKRNTSEKGFSISLPKRTGVSTNAPSTSRSNSSYGEGNLPTKSINILPKTISATSRSNSYYGEGNLLTKSINSLPKTIPATSRSNSYYGEGNLLTKSINSLPKTISATSRSNSYYGEGNLLTKSINILPKTISATSRSNSYYSEGNLPTKKINNLTRALPSTARTAATKRKQVM